MGLIEFLTAINASVGVANSPVGENDDGLWHDVAYFDEDDGLWHDASYFDGDDGLWHDEAYF